MFTSLQRLVIGYYWLLLVIGWLFSGSLHAGLMLLPTVKAFSCFVYHIGPPSHFSYLRNLSHLQQLNLKMQWNIQHRQQQ